LASSEQSILDSVLSPERIYQTSATSKEELLHSVLDRLTTCGDIDDLEGLRSAIFAREALMSTGIGLGVGVPHARISSVRNMTLAVAVNKTPLADYESIDGDPVRLVFLVAGRPDQQSQYVRLLAVLSHVVKHDEQRTALLSATSTEEIYKILQESA